MADQIIAIILLAFNLSYLYLTMRLEKRGFTTGEIGPEAYPTVLIVVLFVLGFFLWMKGRMKIGQTQKKFLPQDQGPWRPVLAFGLMIGYVIFLSHAGFLLSTPIFLILFTMVYRIPHWWMALVTSGATTLIIYAVFWKLFSAPLP